ncbi:uncharacterized protein LOC120703504 [Panicum virgatum]|uniref:uncharacterized protein LOC120703504 n=1 Tax=Panicum virgatum TaxID=38727 RepID=UPI0019D57360|nr:uncharacterized protein LOC120703504 [Panicum virgatum]
MTGAESGNGRRCSCTRACVGVSALPQGAPPAEATSRPKGSGRGTSPRNRADISAALATAAFARWILVENPSVRYFHFLDSSLEGRRQHMWMVHAIGRRQQAQARWATRHTPALPKGTARTTGLRAMKSHHTTTFPALLARCLVKSVYSNSSRPVHRYGLELCNFSKGVQYGHVLVHMKSYSYMQVALHILLITEESFYTFRYSNL